MSNSSSCACGCQQDRKCQHFWSMRSRCAFASTGVILHIYCQVNQGYIGVKQKTKKILGKKFDTLSRHKFEDLMEKMKLNALERQKMLAVGEACKGIH